MIKTIVELYPAGYYNKKKLLGEMEIWNDLSGTLNRGNYKYIIKGKRKTLKEGRYENFPRKSCNVWNLLKRILRQIENI